MMGFACGRARRFAALAFFLLWTGSTTPAAAANVTIAGTVRAGGVGLAGVRLTLQGTSLYVTTDSLGRYSQDVPSGSSGTVVPSKSCYTFTPTSRTYNNVTSNQTIQDYTAIASGPFTISGSAMVPGVSMSGLPGPPVTGASGNYSASVGCGWSGTVTPTRTGNAFSPTSTTYTNVTANQIQNYTAYTIVTITTSPPGLFITWGDSLYPTPYTFYWVPGSSQTIGTTSPQTGAGTRRTFANWSDAGALSHTITAPATAATYTATFTIEYLLTTAVWPPGAGTVSASTPSADGYYASGASVQLTAAANANYQFANWSGDLTGSTKPQSVTMSAPRSVTANFSSSVTVATSPPGLSITVDGDTRTAPQTFNWVAGSSHTISTTSPQTSVGGFRRTFANWSDTGALSHTVAAPATPTTYTANFTTEYLLTTAVSPSGAGTVTASPPSADGYYASGASVQLTAAAIATYQFASWYGGLTGKTNPQSVVMSEPRLVRANFMYSIQDVTVATSPAGLAITVDGTSYTAPQTFKWWAGSSHTIATTSPQTGSGTRLSFANWSDAGAQSHTVTVPFSLTPTTYTATFTTEYLLTSAVSPPGAGTVTASPPSADGYYASGASVQLTAAANANYQFANWSGDLSGSTNPQSVTMSAPRSVTANFAPVPPITVATSPPGLSITVDGETRTAPQTFNWVAGSSHIIATTSPQSSAGTRRSFANWSDAGALSHTITVPSSPTTYTATFTTEYLLTTAVSPSGAGTVTASPPSADGYYASGASVQLTATANANYQFANWSGDLAGSTNPQSVTMSAPRTATANFSSIAGVTVATSPPGLAITVDGTPYTAPQTFNWVAGSSHTIATTSPQSSAGTRRSFANWSDAGALSHAITAPSSPTTYTATFTTEYLLTTAVSPSGAGTVTASPPSADGYYASGASVQLTAAANGNYQFANWSGDLSGNTNPQSITMSAPRSVTANFSSLTGVTVATSPPGLAITVDGTPYTAPQTFNWVAGSSHTIATTSPQSSAGTRRTFANWSDAGALSHTVTAPATATTYTVTFNTEYLLTTAVSPPGAGTVTASPPSADGYYASGASVQLTTTANANYQFANWSGDLSGNTNPQSVTMSAPRSVTANFSSITGVTVATSPPGLAITVDGTPYTAPQTFNWTAGSSHTIATTSPQSSAGTRRTFANWSDAGALSHTVTAPATATAYTASFNTEYLLTTAVSPAAGGSVAAGPPSADGYYAAGASVQLTAAANANYQFANWSGDLSGNTSPQSVTMSAPRSVTANFSSITGVTVATSPPGLAITVDGAPYTAPQTFNWTAGSSHTIATTSPQSSAGTRRTFANWSDAGALSHTITAPATAATYTATFTTEYLLATAVSPSGAGAVTASTPSADGYYASGASVQLTAVANSGYQFANWSGDLSGNTSPQSVTMSAPRSATANFTAIQTLPVVLAVVNAASYAQGAVSPGLIATVYGDRIGPVELAVAAPADGMFPTVLAGTRAFFDGVPGALIYTSQKQLSVVIPYSVYSKAAVDLVVEYNGQRSAAYRLEVADAVPGIFALDASGTGPGAILNNRSDGLTTVNTAKEPAPRESYISVYMTGEGQTEPDGVDGLVAFKVLPQPLLKVSATIAGVAAFVQYAGGAPYLVAGAMQVNLRVPAEAPAGPAVPVVIRVGNKQTQAGITVAIGP